MQLRERFGRVVSRVRGHSGFRRCPACEAARRRADAAEDWLQAVLDALPEGVVVLDAEGRYVLWNRRYSEIYHRSADLFERGKRLLDTLRIGVQRGDYPDAAGREEEWLAERERALENPAHRHEQQISDGTWLMIEERRMPNGGVVGLRIDITAMKRQAAEIEQGVVKRTFAMERLAASLSRLAHGDLTCQVEAPFAPEYEPLRIDFNEAVASMAEAVARIRALADCVSAESEEIARAADDLSRHTEAQAASLQASAAALDQVTRQVSRTAEDAGEAGEKAAEAGIVSGRSQASIEQATETIEAMRTSAGQIATITATLDEIALKTKMLAFNASIEASRAGGAGRGFSLIAQEVRELSDDSSAAARTINGIVLNSTETVSRGTVLVEEAGEAIVTLIEAVSSILARAQDIAARTRDQAVSLEQVNAAIVAMDLITQRNAAQAEEATAAAHKLKREAERLRDETARFRTPAPAVERRRHGDAGRPPREFGEGLRVETS